MRSEQFLNVFRKFGPQSIASPSLVNINTTIIKFSRNEST